MKDQSTSTTTEQSQSQTGTTEQGDSFLTGKKEEPKVEVKTEEPKTEGEKKEEPKVEGAPEKYADFKLPEGYNFDTKELEKATTLFKDMNLTQDQAQKLVDHYAENNLQAQQAPYKAWADLQKQWVSDIGERFGSKADEVRTDINKAITNVLPPSLQKSFKTALDLTGAGSHPDVVEALHILLKPFAEGGSVRQGNPSPGANKPPGEPAKPSVAEAMYPHLVNNRS